MIAHLVDGTRAFVSPGEATMGLNVERYELDYTDMQFLANNPGWASTLFTRMPPPGSCGHSHVEVRGSFAYCSDCGRCFGQD